MLDVDAFISIISQDNIEFLVNEKKGFVDIKSTGGINLLDEDGKLVQSLSYQELDSIEISKDGSKLSTGFGNILEVREVSIICF